MSKVLEHAKAYWAAGYNPIPLRLDGTKSPCIPGWKQYQTARVTETDLLTWFGDGLAGIALLTGPISDRLWCLDVDDSEAANGLVQTLTATRPEIWNYACVVATPRNGGTGRQFIFRLDREPPGNQKLAYADPENCLIETRGRGGYFVAVGSPAAVHRENIPYRHWSGCPLTELPTFPEELYEHLLSTARLFNRVQAEETRLSRDDYQGPPQPGDTFNKAADWMDTLAEAGWQIHSRTEDDVVRVTRPGKSVESGWSATLGWMHDENTGQPLLGVFSSNTPCGPRDGKQARILDQFSFWCLTVHGGDFGTAAVIAKERFAAQHDSEVTTYWQSQPTRPEESGFDIQFMSDVTPKNIDWIWPGFIALTKATLFEW